MEISTLQLRKGCAKPIHGGHPWVFADAIAKIDDEKVLPGDEVRIVDDLGTCLGHGFYSSSAIAVRIISRDDAPITKLTLDSRISSALQMRRDVLRLGDATTAGATTAGATTAYRLINSEGDGLGGLIVDVYGDVVVVQVSTAGMLRRVEAILDSLQTHLKPRAILDRSESRARKLEGLEPSEAAALRGTPPQDPFFVREYGIECICDLRAGHAQKTGLYLDQRANRRYVGELAADRHVLDVFSYSGAFSLHAARGGAASLTLMDSSENALELARKNLEHNQIDDADLIHAQWSDGFKLLREQKRQFNFIILDPPKFARRKQDVAQALSGYRELNAQAARLLSPGGLLFTCSCSGNISELEFERAVAAGLRSAGKRAQLLDRRGTTSDHPVPPGFDQGRYLKCLLLHVED